MLKVAESYIQLLTPITETSPVAKAIEKRGEGIHHIGYRVADCGEALASMVAAGATPIDQAPRPEAGVRRWRSSIRRAASAP